MNVLEGSTLTDFRFTRQVRISYGNPDDTQLLADNLPQYPIVVKPDGSQMAYLLDKQLFRLDIALKALTPISFDRKRWDYLHENDNTIEVYKMAWRPNSTQIFLYNHAIDGLGYTYILDTDTGRLCNLNFGGWAKATHWSPNGRYLAIIRAQGAVPIGLADVTVLDTTTGNFYTLKVAESEIKGGYFVQDIAWAPDNRHLLFTVETAYSQSTYTYSGLLYLDDFISGQSERILSSYEFNIDAGSTNLAWSLDGSKLLMNCPTSEGVKQVCLIPVQTGVQ
jgi:dipeptidyl aminopeptidase/acylaminoacyl peptidase